MATASWSKAAWSRWRAVIVGSDFIVATAQILDKRMTGGDDPRGPATFQAAHRP
jgi:hypothetical protein